MSIWYSFHPSRKDGRLSQPWSHWVIFNPGPLDSEFSALTTTPLLQLQIQRFYAWILIICLAKLWDPYSFQGSRGPLFIYNKVQRITSSKQDCLWTKFGLETVKFFYEKFIYIMLYQLNKYHDQNFNTRY